MLLSCNVHLLNGPVFIYELGGCGLEPRCSHLNSSLADRGEGSSDFKTHSEL